RRPSAAWSQTLVSWLPGRTPSPHPPRPALRPLRYPQRRTDVVDASLTSLQGILRRLRAAAARIHLAFDERTLGHHQARRLDVAVNRRGRLQDDPLGRREVAGHRAADADRLRRQVGLHGGAGANHQTLVPDFDGPFHLTVNGEVLPADDVPLDRERAANPC